FSGNTHPDAVVIANGKPVLRESVETFETYIVANVTVNDIATLHGGGVGGRDRVVAVGSSGLRLLELLNPPANPAWSNTPIRDSGYATSGILVEIGDVDGVNGPDIVVATTNRILIVRAASGGGWMTAPNDVSVIAGVGITDLELLDWDGAAGGALEMAICMDATTSLPGRLRMQIFNGTI